LRGLRLTRQYFHFPTLSRGAEKTFHPLALRNHLGAALDAVEIGLLLEDASAVGDLVRECLLLHHPGAIPDGVEEGYVL
jgi:hypothetical protein